MSRARQFAVVAAVAGTLLLATSSAAPQPWSSRIEAARIATARAAMALAAANLAAAQRAAGPGVCLANRPCPALHASICFASAVVREPACPLPKVTYRFAQAPQGERR
jgi:hypothetical protein